MSDKIIENNQVTIMGEVASQFTFSHEVFGEGFYMVEVLVKRLSNSDDRIPLMISERLIDVHQDYTGEYIMVTGQFRSYNHHDEQKNRLVLSVFVREVTFVEEELDGAEECYFKSRYEEKTSWCPPFQGHAAYLSCRDCTMCRRRRTFHQKDD